MGPCTDCGKWTCLCWKAELVRHLEREQNKCQYEAIIAEHRQLAATHDSAFQAFLSRLLA